MRSHSNRYAASLSNWNLEIPSLAVFRDDISNRNLPFAFSYSVDTDSDLARLGGLSKRLTLHDSKIDNEFRFLKISKIVGSV